VEKDFRLTPIVIEYGSVAGTVLGVTPDSNLQIPLTDALVSLIPRYDSGFPPDVITLHPGAPAAFVQSVTTDDNGYYEFGRVPVGLYDLHASARGWGKTSAPADVIKDETTEVDLVIVHTPPPAPGSLEGTVWLQPEGATTVVHPASGAEVIAIPADSDWIDWPLGSDPAGIDIAPYPVPRHFVTRTDSEGHYRFGVLRPGKYHLIASYRGHHPGEEIVEVVSQQTTVQDFVLIPIPTGPGRVIGRVTFSPPSMASEPQPIAGAKVVLVGQNDFPIPILAIDPNNPDGLADLLPDILYETKTNDRGYFEFPNVRPGHYVAYVSAEDFQSARQEIWVSPGQTVSLHFDLVPDTGGGGDAILEGGVYAALFAKTVNGDLPHPIAGATVIAIPICPNCDLATGVFGPDGQFPTPKITTTNERGRYRFGSLEPGYTAVIAIADGFLPAVQFIHLPAGQASVLNFWLESSGGNENAGLYGMISQWTPYPTFAPVPVEGAHIVLEPLFPLPLDPTTGPFPYLLETKSDERGNYRFPNLAPGPYSMDVRAEGFDPVEDLEVHIPPGEKVRQDAVMYPKEGSSVYRGGVYEIEGDVPPEDAKIVLHPIPGAIVRLVPDWMAVIEIFPPPNVGFDRITDNQGMFVFDNLPAGGYGVTILKEGFVPQTGHIVLDENQVLEQDWFLSPNEHDFIRLRGRIQEDTGELDIWIPVEGATVLLQGEDANLTPPLTTQSGPDGDFDFPPVEAGDYHLVVEAEGYERQEIMLDLGSDPEPFILIELLPQLEPDAVGSR